MLLIYTREETDIDEVDSYSSIHDHECNCIGESRVLKQSYFLHVYLYIQRFRRYLLMKEFRRNGKLSFRRDRSLVRVHIPL